jgi:hypothetical protein
MIRYECDMCGQRLGANDPSRYIVKIEVYAAAGHLDLDQQAKLAGEPTLDSLCEQLAQADPDEVEDQTYRCLRFDVCDSCRRAFLAQPLRRRDGAE